MDSEFYTNIILRDTLVPFIEMTFGPNHRFQQDNDPKHTSRHAKEFMEDHGINWLNVWPAGKSFFFLNELNWFALNIRYLVFNIILFKVDMHNNLMNRSLM